MCLDRKSMGLTREEVRRIEAGHLKVEAIQIAMEDRILDEFTQAKAISKEHAAQAIRGLKNQLEGNVAHVQHWPAKSSNVQGRNALRYHYARTSNMQYTEVKSLRNVQLNKTAPRIREDQSVVFAQCTTLVERRFMHVQHSLCGVSLNFHTMARMVERGFARSHPATTFMRRPDFSVLVGSLMAQGILHSVRRYDKTHSAAITVDDAVMVGMHLMEHVESDLGTHLSTTPAQMKATPDQRIADLWGGTVGKITPNSHPLSQIKQDNRVFQPSVRMGTYLDHNMMMENQWHLRDMLGEFQRTHAAVLDRLALSFTNHDLMGNETAPAFKSMMAHLRDIMERPDWQLTFRANNSVMLRE